ncbi:nucleolysin tiar [Hordeum vulgare]|nr:nucleolysin tiar [Hordeum vulgare]
MATEAEAARNRPPHVPQLRTPAEQMAFLVSTVQGMEKNIQVIIQNQKSLERVVETKFHNMDVKVTELTTIVKQLQHEVDCVEIPRSEDEDEDEDDYDEEDESPPPTTIRMSWPLQHPGSSTGFSREPINRPSLRVALCPRS